MQPSNTEPSENTISYNANDVLHIFQLFGKPESAKPGQKVFKQGEKAGFLSFQSNKMYFLVEGTVTIKSLDEVVSSIGEGEIFGEFTPFSTRSMTAIADAPCKFMTLNEKQLIEGLKTEPKLLLMLIDVFVKFLRNPSTAAKTAKPVAKSKDSSKDELLDSKMLKDLVKEVGENAIIDMPKQRVIFKEGGNAMLMYVILDGQVIISSGNKLLGRSGAGAVIGEIALVDQKSRTATVTSETHCSLLAINSEMLHELTQKLPSFGIALLRILSSRQRFDRAAVQKNG